MLFHQLVYGGEQLAAAQNADRPQKEQRKPGGARRDDVRDVLHADARRRARRDDRHRSVTFTVGHVVFTACPPNSLRSAAITLAPNDSSWRDRNRACSDSVITGAGTSRSIASCTVHRPSPESATQPLSDASDASRSNAFAASALSHDRTTLPRSHTLAICARSSDANVFDAWRIS